MKLTDDTSKGVTKQGDKSVEDDGGGSDPPQPRVCSSFLHAERMVIEV